MMKKIIEEVKIRYRIINLNNRFIISTVLESWIDQSIIMINLLYIFNFCTRESFREKEKKKYSWFVSIFIFIARYETNSKMPF